MSFAQIKHEKEEEVKNERIEEKTTTTPTTEEILNQREMIRTS